MVETWAEELEAVEMAAGGEVGAVVIEVEVEVEVEVEDEVEVGVEVVQVPPPFLCSRL